MTGERLGTSWHTKRILRGTRLAIGMRHEQLLRRDGGIRHVDADGFESGSVGWDGHVEHVERVGADGVGVDLFHLLVPGGKWLT